MRPRRAAAATARAASTETWAVKALVEATPISGPAWVGQSTLASRAMVDWCALTTAAVTSPWSAHQRSAAKVSAVSPDCEMAIARVFGDRAAPR